MKRYQLYFVSVLCAIATLNSCQDGESFDNKAYINSNNPVGVLLIKSSVSQESRTIQAALAKPAQEEITLTYRVDPSLVSRYNAAYYDQAVMLPEAHYELPEPQAKITAGSVRSTDVIVHFKALNQLDRETVYVLPVTIAQANIDLLESGRTSYYVLKGAALINVVADIEENYLHIDKWATPAVVNSLSKITMEALIRARNYDRLISTVMGIEGRFLIRLGDAGFPSNQIQVASSRNFPAADSNKGLSTNEWNHIAVTYDATNGEMKIYVNGAVQSEGINQIGKVSLGVDGVNGFYIGRSYADERFLAGEISECRIWNVVRTKEEIAQNPYEVDPASEGLVAYWKCNEGGGNVVKDQTANGNHLTAKSGTTLKWTPVSLPASNK